MQPPQRVGHSGAGGGLGMSRLDAVIRVLKATGKALHYDVITRQALQQGIIRFTGSQGTAGESMKVSAPPSVLLFSLCRRDRQRERKRSRPAVAPSGAKRPSSSFPRRLEGRAKSLVDCASSVGLHRHLRSDETA